MDEIQALIAADPKKAINILKSQQKDKYEIDKLRKEFKELNRNQRQTQIGKTQKDKLIGPEGDKTLVLATRITIPFQNRVVGIATAFEVGQAVTITPDAASTLSDEILRLWDVNRMDSKLQELIRTKKSETECAIMFYIDDLKPQNLIGRLLGLNKNKEIKSRVLKQDKSRYYSYFDEFGDMKAFTWEFSETKLDGKTINHTWVFDKTNIYKIENNGTPEVAKHGFSVIPIVYDEQDYPEWYEVQSMIDRLETAMSKLGGSNDRTAHPILKLYGEAVGSLDKNDEGKVIKFPMKESIDNPGKFNHGDADYLTNPNAPESSKLELDKLEQFIYTISSTPNLSFDNLKGLGNVSGTALRFMFLDAILKAKMNEGSNRTFIQRCLNVMISGTITTTNIAMKSQAKDLMFAIQFNSILPNDLKETVDILSTAVQAGLASRKTGVDILDLTDDNAAELEEINKEAAAKVPEPGATV